MKKYLTLLLLTVVAWPCLAQELISTAGDVQTDGAFVLSWSLGEPVNESYMQGGDLLTQGFQQVGEMTTSLEDLPEQLAVNFFPNPCQDQIYLSLANPGQYRITMQDASGRILLKQADHFTGQYVLDVRDLPAGSYTLWIRHPGDQASFSTTILKSN